MDDNDLILKISETSKIQGEEKILKSYLLEFFSEIKILDEEPNWENCIKIGPLNSNMVKEDFDNIFNIFTGQLQHVNKIGLDMAKYNDFIYLRTN